MPKHYGPKIYGKPTDKDPHIPNREFYSFTLSHFAPGQNFLLPIAEVQGGTQRVSLHKVATTNLSSSATGGNQIPIVQPAGSHLTSRAIQYSVVTQRGTVLDKLTVS